MSTSGKERKNIRLTDENGLLTREALMGYAYGELSPMQTEEVAQMVQGNTMYQDAIEGLKEIPEKSKADNTVGKINQQIAAKSGAPLARVVNMQQPDYRKIAAAVVGALLLASITLVLLNTGEEAESELITEAPTKKLEPMVDKNEQESITTGIDKDSSLEIAEIIEPEDEFIAMSEPPVVDDNNEPKKSVDLVEEASEPEAPVQKRSEDNQNKKQEDQVAKSKKTESTDEDRLAATGNSAASQLENARIEPPAEPAESDIDLKDEFGVNTNGYVSGGAQSRKSLNAEQQPQFPGGQAAMLQYIKDNLKYPKKAKRDGVEGKVYVSFNINQNGKVTEVYVVKGINEDLDKEAKRVVENMPDWTPGYQNGKAIKVKQQLPIVFSLD